MKSNRWIILVAAVVLLFLTVLALQKAGLFSYAFGGGSSRTDEAIALSAVVLIGLALVVVLMAALVIVYWVLDVANKDQALALPEGSVRALIAFSLVLIFVCLGAFLYNNVNSPEASVTGKLNKISEAQVTELEKQFIVASEPARDDKGAQLTEAGGKLYNVTYFSKRSKEGDDFAKQIFTTLATVFVSVISFYFGSSSAVSAVKAARDAVTGQKTTPPSITKLEPDTLPVNSPSTPLKILGDGLESVTSVKFGSVAVKPTNAADKLVNVMIPSSVLAQHGIVKVSVVGNNGESSSLDFTVN